VEVDETESMAGTVHELVAAVAAREVEPGADGRRAFVTTSPRWWGGRRTFGGMVVAQALHAACHTVPDGLVLHSLHGYFLRPSLPGSTSTHLVEPVRDGRAFTTREVTTEVEGRHTFRMTCSFHVPEAGDEYQLPMEGEVPRPEEIAGVEAPFPFDLREIGATDRRADGTYASTRRFWCRTRERLPDNPAMHACVLAYLSDMTGAAFRPLSLATWGTHTDASLDHSLWFHRPRRADEWNLFDMTTVVNAGGRSTMRATVYGDDGLLYLTMTQELLIRELEVPIDVAAPPWVAKTPQAPDEQERSVGRERQGQREGKRDGAT
jgi:acyl-CoA thioesterase II